MHVAGAALARVAADMGPGEAEIVAQELDQQGAGRYRARDRLAVDRHRNLRLGHAASTDCTASVGRE